MYDDIPVKLNEIYSIEIMDLSTSGEGIGKLNSFTLFVKGLVPGDFADVLITKIKKRYAYGEVVKILSSSSIRTDFKCDQSNICGGCLLANIKYEEQLKIKRKIVKDALERIGGFKDIYVDNTIGMRHPYNFRNKAVYHLGKINNEIVAGFFEPKSHDLIPIGSCNIFHQSNTIILEAIVRFFNNYKISVYDYERHTGLVRHIMIRTAFKTNEIMICLVINGRKLPHYDKLLIELLKIPFITSVVMNVNTKKTKEILGDDCITLWGSSFITEYIGSIKLQISANSFFQVNTIQMEKLYDMARKFLHSNGKQLLDFYCGIGSLTLYLAKSFEKIIGIDSNSDAINDALKNAKQNNINNVYFVCDNVEDAVKQFSRTKIEAVVLDPPRTGCHVSVLEALVTMNIDKIVYISCNAASLARDLRFLCEYKYKLEKIQPVDMFGHSTHVECVVLMSRKDG